MSDATPPVQADAPPRRAAASARHAYLEQVLTALWPEPARVRNHNRSRPALDTSAGGGRREFLLLPRERSLRILVPRAPRRATAAAIRDFKLSASRRTRWELRCLALAARAGLGELLPDRLTIEIDTARPEASLDGFLAHALHEELFVSIHIGPARANRKPIVQLLSPRGVTLGFAKVGLNDLTRTLVRREADTLEFLSASRFSTLAIPELWYRGRWHDHEVLVMRALARSRPPTRDRTVVTRAMEELARVRGATRSIATASPYWARLRHRLELRAHEEHARHLAATLDALEATASKTSLEFGSWHGDWTPWNTALSGHRVLVWDWERFDTGVPMGFDAVHDDLQNAVVHRGRAPLHAAEDTLTRAPVILAPFGVVPEAATLTAILYLIEIGTRYLEDGQAEAGASLGRLGSWLLPVLTTCVERHAGPSR